MVQEIASYIGVVATVLLVLGVVAMLYITYVATKEGHETEELKDDADSGSAA